MRLSSTLSALALASTLLAVAGAQQTSQPAVRPADDYAAFDAHPSEHVTVAAEPLNTPEKLASVFHLNYLAYAVLPVRVVVTNQGDTPVSLAEARIDFITAAGDKIPAAEPEDVERLVSRPGANNGYKVGPLTLGKHKPKQQQVAEDFRAYEYSSIAVEPHSTRSGFLFYDLETMAELKPGAHLELRRMQNSTGKELFAFEVPFDKYLTAASSAKP